MQAKKTWSTYILYRFLNILNVQVNHLCQVIGFCRVVISYSPLTLPKIEKETTLVKFFLEFQKKKKKILSPPSKILSKLKEEK